MDVQVCNYKLKNKIVKNENSVLLSKANITSKGTVHL